ncbi:MAG TPA: TOBE domain-containing protein, partial [Ramlibacter sp.]|nr:TOBE domain-containing protein [Ramlibacter sp.]
FLTGRSRAGAVDFGGFVIPTRALAADGQLPDEIQVSIRPQSIHLLRDKPAASDQRCCVEGSVQRRAYLGESWDYHISFAPDLEPIRVTARPGDVFEVGQKIYADIDTSQITIVS